MKKEVSAPYLQEVDMAEDVIWAGMEPIRRVSNRVRLPGALLELEIAETERTLFWAYNFGEDAVVISRLRDAFWKNDRFEQNGSSQVTDTRMAHIPGVVMDEQSGFEYGKQLYFVATEAYAAENMCLVLSEDVAQDRFGDEFRGLFGGEDE